jgi:hypothetical protein
VAVFEGDPCPSCQLSPLQSDPSPAVTGSRYACPAGHAFEARRGAGYWTLHDAAGAELARNWDSGGPPCFPPDPVAVLRIGDWVFYSVKFPRVEQRVGRLVDFEDEFAILAECEDPRVPVSSITAAWREPLIMSSCSPYG